MPQRKSIKHLEPGETIAEAYNRKDVLILSDYEVDSEMDVERLKAMGIAYYIPGEGTALPNEVVSQNKQVPDRTPEEVIDDKLDSVQTYVNKTEELYESTTKKLEETFLKVHRDEITLEELKELTPYIQKFLQFVERSPASVSVLTQIENYDEETYQHSINVSILSLLYGRHRGMDEEDLMDLAMGAMIHDIGKTKLPRELLHKIGSYSEEEKRLMHKHPQLGLKILRELDADPIYQDIALEHHERPDGSGYPRKTPKAHPYSRIVSVIDVYEALTSPRSYKDRIIPLHAFQMLKDQFNQYEETARILRGLVHCLGIFPVGSVVRLTNNEVGVVQSNHVDNLKKPVVSIIFDPEGEPVEQPYRLDLKKLEDQELIIDDKVYDEKIRIKQQIALENIEHPKETLESVFQRFGF